MKIPFVDLQTQHARLHGELMAAVSETLISATFVMGPALGRFETEFARFCTTRYALGVGTGLDALALALRARGVGHGDEVIVPANTFIATALGVSQAGATPVLVDVDPVTYNIDPSQVEAAITPRTRALMPVHLYGQMADMDPLVDLAHEHDLYLVEDAAQAHGAEYKGRRAGSIGAVGCFSFYPAKNLGACGDGGAVVTSDEKLYREIGLLRNYGSPAKYIHDRQGSNTRLDTLQAAVLHVKLRHLDEWNDRRRQVAQWYREALAAVPEVVTPAVGVDRTHVYHLYVIQVERRDALMAHLHEAGVGAQIHYPIPIHEQVAYRSLGYSTGAFPVTEDLAPRLLSVPMFPEMTESQVAYVAQSIQHFYSRTGACVTAHE